MNFHGDGLALGVELARLYNLSFLVLFCPRMELSVVRALKTSGIDLNFHEAEGIRVDVRLHGEVGL